MNTPETKSATEETARKVADYSNDVMEKVTHRFHYMYLISIATVLIYLSWTTLIFRFARAAGHPRCLPGHRAGYADRRCHFHQQVRQ